MSKNKKRIIMIAVVAILYIVPIIFLYMNYRRKPEVIMVSRRYCISAVTQEQSPYEYLALRQHLFVAAGVHRQ